MDSGTKVTHRFSVGLSGLLPRLSATIAVTLILIQVGFPLLAVFLNLAFSMHVRTSLGIQSIPKLFDFSDFEAVEIPFWSLTALSPVIAWRTTKWFFDLGIMSHFVGSIAAFAPGDAAFAGKSGSSSLIMSLERRIKQLNSRCTWILCIIVCSIVSSVIVIIFAGKLTTLDAAAVSNLAIIKAEISSLDDMVESNGREISRAIANKKARVQKDIQKPTAQSQSSPATESAPSPDASAERDDDTYISELQEQRASIVDRRNQSQNILNKIWQAELVDTTKDKLSDTNFVAATFLIRFSVIVMMIFLIQIFISLLRFNMRLISFYSSRLDSMRVWDGVNVDGLKNLADILTPSHVDFGREPRHPVDHLLNGWRAVFGSRIPDTGPMMRARQPPSEPTATRPARRAPGRPGAPRSPPRAAEKEVSGSNPPEEPEPAML